MNRLTTSMLLTATAAWGFAAGWLTVDRKSGPPAFPALKVRPVTAPTPAAAATAEDSAPEFPALTTVAECRAFWYGLTKHAAGRHPLMRGASRDYALRRWLEIDAESALTEAERLPGNEFTNEGFAADLFRVWLDLNIESAIGAWNQANPVLARNVRIPFLTALADKDPARAFAVWESPRGKAGGPHDGAEEIILRRWAATEPRAAAAKATTELSLSAVLETWALTDPAAALACVQEQSADASERDFVWAFLSSALFPAALRTDPAAVQAIVAGANQYARFNGAQWWARHDAAGALHWAQNQPPDGPMVRETLMAAAGKLASSDPELALQVLQSLTSSRHAGGNSLPEDYLTSAHREAFAALAATDPARARELIRAQPDLAKKGALDGYLTFAFADDMPAAIAQCREWLADPAMKAAATSAVLMAFRWDHGAGARDPSEVLAELPELVDKIDAAVLSGWAKSNPSGAAEFITRRAAAGKPVDGLQAEGVLAEIAIAQPEWTSYWLRRLPDAALQAEAAGTLAANWAAFDPDAAGRWIDSLPDGPLRDAALTGFDHRAGSGTELSGQGD